MRPTLLGELLKLSRRLLRSTGQKARGGVGISALREFDDEDFRLPVSTRLNRNIAWFKRFFEETSDLTVKTFLIGNVEAAIFFVDGLIDRRTVESSILTPLMLESRKLKAMGSCVKCCPDDISRILTAVQEIRAVSNIKDAIWGLVDGDTVLSVSGWDRMLVMSTKNIPARSVEEPATEAGIRGPRDGFVEDIVVNLGLLRRRIRHPALRIKSYRIGRLSRTRVFVMYIQDVASPRVLEELEKRLMRIETDAILDSGFIEEYIEDSPLSIFPQVGSTERPDRASAALASGRIVIMVDGTPFVLIVPADLISFLQTPEDYFQRWAGSLIPRLIRLVNVLVAILLPGVYVAFTTYHQELIPTQLAIAIAVQRQAVPYPAVVEALIATVLFEVILEAVARLPRTIGNAVGIVGGIVIGDAVVKAGLVSPVMIIVIAFTGLSQFTVAPPLAIATRLLRLPFLFLGSALGMYGIFLGSNVLLIHVCSLRSFGEPYLVPLAPAMIPDLFKDTFIRLPRRTEVTRPALTGARNPITGKPISLRLASESVGKLETEVAVDQKGLIAAWKKVLRLRRRG